eukprot:8985662-Alexandrium_andersonii.AAC.1
MPAASSGLSWLPRVSTRDGPMTSWRSRARRVDRPSFRRWGSQAPCWTSTTACSARTGRSFRSTGARPPSA